MALNDITVYLNRLNAVEDIKGMFRGGKATNTNCFVVEISEDSNVYEMVEEMKKSSDFNDYMIFKREEDPENIYIVMDGVRDIAVKLIELYGNKHNVSAQYMVKVAKNIVKYLKSRSAYSSYRSWIEMYISWETVEAYAKLDW